MATQATGCGMAGDARAILGAATQHRRLNRVSALVLADCLEDCGDGRAALVRGLAGAAPVEVGDAWRPPLPAGGAGVSCYWSGRAGTPILLSVRASSPCLPAGSGEFCDHLVARFIYAGKPCSLRRRSPRRAPPPYVYYRLRQYHPTGLPRVPYCQDFRLGFSAPNGSGGATLAATAYNYWAAAILNNLFPAQSS